MPIGIAALSHETHTFLPDTTGLERFEQEAFRGDALLDRFRGTNTATGGFIDVLEEAAEDPHPVVHAKGGVSGTVEDAVYDTYVTEMREGFEDVDLDGVLLFLHGAMVTESRRDPETDVVRAVRDVVGDVPIAVAMDLHGNVDPALLEVADVVCAYRSSPHVDGHETGRRAARLLLRTLDGDVAPAMAMAKPGLAVPTVFSATTTEPARALVSRALAWERQPELFDVTRWRDRDDVLDVSVFFGFPWSDVPQNGVAPVAVTDDNPELADAIVSDLAQALLEHADALTAPDHLYSVEDGIAYALERAETASKPVCVLDHADRLNETTFVLRELLAQDATNVAVPLLYDPAVAAACVEAGVGETVTVSVGSKSSPRGGRPVDVTGTVAWAGELTYEATGPMRRGKERTHGPTAVLETDGVWLQVVSRRENLIDRDPIEQYGFDLADFDVVVSKSKTHFRAVYEDAAAEIVVVDAPEYSPADLGVYEFEHVRPGVYPITAETPPR